MPEKSVVRTDRAPAPFQGAPYSQAIVAGGLVFVAGQLGWKPGETEFAGGIEEQTELVFSNLAAILEEAGSSLERLVKTTVFLADLGEFEGMNEVYARHVGDTPPARATVGIRLPDGLKVEIEKAAAREGVSVNTWIVRALSRTGTSAPAQQSGNRLTGYARS